MVSVRVHTCLVRCFFNSRILISHHTFTCARMAHTAALTISALNKQITVHTGLFINNEFVPSVDSSQKITYDLMYRISPEPLIAKHRALNPATEDVICSVDSGKFTQCQYTVT
jgi:aldehyde dehydrogenase (NAD+)